MWLGPANRAYTAPAGVAPGAVSNLLLSQQGDSTNNGQSANGNVQSISWGAATAGSYPIDHYQIRRRIAQGAFSDYAVTANASILNFTDNAANGSYYANNINEQTGAPGVHDNGTGPTTVYGYDVVAVDTQGNRGPGSSDCKFWFYQGGQLLAYNSGADLSGPNTANYADTTLSPPTGTADILVTLAGANGFLQAPSWSPGTWIYGMEGGDFNYLNFKIKPTVANASFYLSFHSRGTVGDIGQPFVKLDISNYGPVPTSGVWGSYKVPLSPLGFGVATFTGSISGGTLTASGWSGCAMDSGGWISWAGQTTPTQIQQTPSQSGNGTYGVAGTTSQASTAMQYNRSNFYKINIQQVNGSANTVKFGVTDVYMSRV